MRPGVTTIIAAVCAIAGGVAPAAHALPVSAVNPFVGTASTDPDITRGGGAGATVPGAAVPFGLVQMSPETAPADEAFGAGYAWKDSRIRGFSPTHISGTGCAVFGDVPVLPVAGAATRPTTSRFSHAHESASPGAYDVVLEPGTPRAVGVRLTATERVGVLRMAFPRGRPATVLVDAGGSQTGDDRASVRVDPSRGEVVASAESGRFCGRDNRYRVSTVLRFSGARPQAFGTWSGSGAAKAGSRAAADARPATGSRPVPGGFPTTPVHGAQAGAYLRFAPGATVEVRIGVSFVDAAGARRNLDAEAGASRSFSALRAAARATWQRALDRVRVAGGTAAQRATLATALYHALLHPNLVGDADGRYPGLDGKVHTATGYRPRSTIAGWDAYRTQFPLLSMVFPEQARDVVRSLLAGAREQGGCLPDWTVAGADTHVMVGEPGAILLAEARAFGVGGATAQQALAAATAATTPPCRADADLTAGAAAVTLERATADAAVARLGGTVPPTDWRAVATTLAAADPASAAGLVEGSAAQYLWAPAAFDLPALTALLGGPANAAGRLAETLTRLDAGPFSPFADLGNEPSFALPWIGSRLGRPDLTQPVVARALARFAPTPAGLPGNDDAGALSSWFVLSALGLYPATPGDDRLQRAAPLFPRVRLTIPGRSITIAARRGTRPSAPEVGFADLQEGSRLAFERTP
jgi:predicted alpha-1,2-mannosidase